MKRRTEQATQIATVRFLEIALPPDIPWTAINPISSRSPIHASLCKAMGLRAGVLDLSFWFAGAGYLIEMKAEDGTLSDDQKTFGAKLDAQHIRWGVARSVEEVESRLRFWGFPLRATVMTPALMTAFEAVE